MVEKIKNKTKREDGCFPIMFFTNYFKRYGSANPPP